MRTIRKYSGAGAPLADDAVERAMARLRAELRERGLRASTVRDAIARAALRYDGHFEANDLLRELRAAGVRDAHLATIYRTLPLLVEVGLLQPTLLSTGDRQFYEVAFETPHHDHLICTGCGVIVEFTFEAFEVLQRDLAARHDFELTGHVHELFGLCGSCRRGKKPAPAPRNAAP